MANHVTMFSPKMAALDKDNKTSENVTDELEALQLSDSTSSEAILILMILMC